MAERGEGAAAPNQRQGQNQQQKQQQQNQDPTGQQQHLHINWLIFKPEFSEKPEEDAEAHLLCSNDWMNTHHFIDGVKIPKILSYITRRSKLWFQSLEPLNNINLARITKFT